MSSSAKSSMATIEQFLNKVGQVKAAEEAHTEPGSIGGATEHPVKDVDDRTEEAKEGERSKENAADVKEDQGGASVDSTPEATTKTGSAASRLAKRAAANPFTANVRRPTTNGQAKKGQVKRGDGGAVSSEGSAADDAEESPLDPQPTGKTPDIETSSAKPGKEDPGSDHPARTDNDSLDGHKYASDADPIKIAADIKTVGDNFLAQLAWMSEQLGNPKQAAEAVRVAGRPVQPQQPARKQASAQIDPHIQMQMGWELAGLANGTMDKAAADRMVQNAVETMIQTASNDAVKVAHYLDHFFASASQAQKQAEGEMPPDPAMMGGDPAAGGDPGAGGMPPGMGGGGPPGGGGGGPPGGGGEEDMMAALGGGADAGGGMPGMGGMPGADGGGGGGGGDAGGGGGDQIDAGQLAQILDALGISEDELQQAMAEEDGGAGGAGGGDMGGGGGDMGGGGGGGMPPGMDAGKAAADRRGGSRQTQKTGATKQGYHRDEMRGYIQELIGRSRRSRA